MIINELVESLWDNNDMDNETTTNLVKFGETRHSMMVEVKKEGACQLT